MNTRIDDMSFMGRDMDIIDTIYGDDVDRIIDEYGLMGSDLENVYMGGWLKNLVNRIKTRVRERRAQRAAAGIPSQYAISTPGGTVSAGAGGFSYMPTGGGQGIQAGLVPVETQQAGIMGTLQKNPMLMMLPVAFLALMMMKKKGGKE